MGPARQGLDAEQRAAAQVDLRLELHRERLLLDRRAQVRQHREAGRVVAVVLGGVDRGRVAGALGDVHRDVGAAEQQAGVRAVLRVRGDADARAHLQALLLQHERLLEQPEAFPRQRLRGRQARAGQEQGELIAAEPGHRVGRADLLAQAQPHLPQQVVPDVVPERVVHRLERVQVDEQERERIAAARREQQRLLQPVAQERPVGQLGDRVEQRAPLQLLAAPDLLADLVRDEQPERRAVRQRADRDLQVNRVSCPVLDRGVVGARRLLAIDRLLGRGEQLLAEQVRDIVQRVAKQLGQLHIGVHDVLVVEHQRQLPQSAQ